MGCASSSDTKHVIDVKPRTGNGAHSVSVLKRGDSNHSHAESRRDKTANNNNADVNDHMLSANKNDNGISTEQTISLQSNGTIKAGENGINGASKNKEKTKAVSRQHELEVHVMESVKPTSATTGKENEKKINRRASDAKTNPSSVTEWETDSELVVDKNIEDISSTANKDLNISRQTEPNIVNHKGLDIHANNSGTDKLQNDKELGRQTENDADNRESNHVIASYVGSDENRQNADENNENAVKAYASYVGTGTDKETNASEKSEQNIHTVSNTQLEAQIDQTETQQKQQQSTTDTTVLEAKHDNARNADDRQATPDSEDKGPFPTLVKAKDIMPSADTLKILADQVKQSPIGLKPSLASLVKRLTKPATTDLEKVWAFYRWIVINIKYDVDAFFGDVPAKPSDPSSVLKTGVALCDGYTNLFMAFCEKSNVEAKVISGFAKPYGYTIGDDVSKLDSCQHKWNAVRIDGNWFLMDCTWGAGFVKPKDKKYIRWPNDFYFLTDPDIFISDHFPMMDNDYETSCKWQLLEMPLTMEMFIQRVNMDQPGKEWGIHTHHHPYAVIDVQNEAEIMIEESHTPMLDYMVHMRNNEYQLMDPFTFCYKLDAKTFKVHVRPPAVGEYLCQIYGRRDIDGKDAHFQPLVLYKINCTEVYDRPREFPKHNVVFGPIPDIERYGFSHTGNVLYKAEFGEITILLNPTREVHFVPHLYIGDTEFDYLRENCIVQYSEDFRHVSISLRLPFEGFFRLTLFGQRGAKQTNNVEGADDRQSDKSVPVYNVKFRRPQSNSSRASSSNAMKPFVSYLIDNRQASDKDPFPFAHADVLKYKCCLLQPTDKEVKTEHEIKVCLRSLFLERVKAGDDPIPKVDETTFAGNTVATKPDAKFIIYGSESTSGDDFMPLYECTTSK